MIPGPGCCCGGDMHIRPPGPPIIGRGCIIGAGAGAPNASKFSKSAPDRPPAGAAACGGCCCGRDGATAVEAPALLSAKSPNGSASGA